MNSSACFPMKIRPRSVAIWGQTSGLSNSRSRSTASSARPRRARSHFCSAGGGKALEVEYQDGDAAGVYEVEVRRADGSSVEVHLNGQFAPVGMRADEDARTETGGADD